MFFRRRGVKGWKGPGKVMGEDGYTILVKLGGSVYKCHRCHVMKVNPGVHFADDIGDGKAKETNQPNRNRSIPAKQHTQFQPFSGGDDESSDSDGESTVDQEDVEYDYPEGAECYYIHFR